MKGLATHWRDHARCGEVPFRHCSPVLPAGSHGGKGCARYRELMLRHRGLYATLQASPRPPERFIVSERRLLDRHPLAGRLHRRIMLQAVRHGDADLTDAVAPLGEDSIEDGASNP